MEDVSSRCVAYKRASLSTHLADHGGGLSQATPAMSTANVKPASLPISGLLSSRFSSFVPRYQRFCSWEDRQVNDLINDVGLLLTGQTATSGHFHCGMVAVSISDSAEPGDIFYEAFDDQQRLATFCLLLTQISLEAGEFESTARALASGAEVERMAMTEAPRHVGTGSSPRSARTRRRPRCTSQPPFRRSAGTRSSACPVSLRSSEILGL
jgi:hypothetical protein